MIRIRIDDVMCTSSAFTNEKSAGRFRAHHKWIRPFPNVFSSVPTILVTEIQGYPEVISFIREETQEGRMFPQLHGFEHIDYAKLNENDIRIHLTKSLEFFSKEFNMEPTIWATPWGGCNDIMKKVAKELVLEVETTDNTISLKEAINLTRKYNTVEILNNQTILLHWWEKGVRLWRLAEVARYGTYEAAKEARRDIF